jgi:endoglucanase
VFVGQVGDERDHDLGFRDPASDDASSAPGIGRRRAYPNMGGDIGGKTAAALALAADRTPAGPARDALIAQARDWYAAGVASRRVAPKLPSWAGDFYVGDTQEDALAAGAAALYRTTGERRFLAAALRYIDQIEPDGRLSWNAVAGFAAADLCGVLGAPGVADAAARAKACDHLGAQGAAAAARGRKLAFGTPGTLGWGSTGENAGAGILAALADRAGKLAGGLAVGAVARDWLLGRNAWDSSFVAGFGPRSPKNVHHWASRRGEGRPKGAVVGGPADLKSIKDRARTSAGSSPAASMPPSPRTRTASTTTSPPSPPSTTPPARSS